MRVLSIILLATACNPPDIDRLLVRDWVPEVICGDGFVDSSLAPDLLPFEECDDGNDDDRDACTNDCRLAACGDRIRRLDLQSDQEDYEACDDGNTTATDDCTNDCAIPYCGDGIVHLTNDPATLEPHEACDDGDDDNFDGCTNACVAARCGDGIVRTDEGNQEECDDQNDIDNDGCNSNCEAERCGNGIIEGEEECDDGNDIATDHCADCKTAFCGDGIVQPDVGLGEECDDGPELRAQDDACMNDCKDARCGDGFVHAGIEGCDDGNENDNDDCGNDCAQADCGNGVVNGDEECDDANDLNTDACTNTCQAASCGDGIVQTGVEECDDANGVNQDACLNDCSLARCGDGRVRSDLSVGEAGFEACDDGNAVETDHCLNNCRLAFKSQVLAVGNGYSCALATEEENPEQFVYCWGEPTAEPPVRMGHRIAPNGRAELVERPRPIVDSDDAMSIHAAYGHSCLLKQNGTVQCWGLNHYGQLGGPDLRQEGREVIRAQAVTLPAPVRILAVGGGEQRGEDGSTAGGHSCAVTDDGRLYCWGANHWGQVDPQHGGEASVPAPVLVSTQAAPVMLALGRQHTCALLIDGAVHCTGANEAGQVGSGLSRNPDSARPVQTREGQDLGAMLGIAAGGNNTCAWNATKSYCWGDRTRGQTLEPLAELPPCGCTESARDLNRTATTWMKVGRATVCGRNEGRIDCWGDNRWGQVTGISRQEPSGATRMGNEDVDVSRYDVLALGISHGCAGNVGEPIVCWGYNYHGQTGVGGPGEVYSFRHVEARLTLRTP